MMRFINNSKAFVVAALLLLVSANRITMDENGGGQSSLLQAIPVPVPSILGEAAEPAEPKFNNVRAVIQNFW